MKAKLTAMISEQVASIMEKKPNDKSCIWSPKGHIFLPHFDLFDWSLFSGSNVVESGRGKRRKQGARAREGRSFYEGIHHVLGG